MIQSSIDTLDLSDNPFNSGPLPKLPKFSSSKILSLRNTILCGLLPQTSEHLPNLSQFHPSYNNSSGSLPEFAGLSSLETLDLSNNQLNGTLPYSIGQLSSLIELRLASNNFSGVISEAHLSNLTRLQYLDISQNFLSFNVSTERVSPFQLETWDIYHHAFWVQFFLRGLKIFGRFSFLTFLMVGFRTQFLCGFGIYLQV